MIPDGKCSAAFYSPPPHKRRAGTDQFQNVHKCNGRGVLPNFLSRCAAHPSSSLRPPKPQAWCRCYLLFLTTLLITMFPKVFLTFLTIGALSVSALNIPATRGPTPEPDCEFPRQ